MKKTDINTFINDKLDQEKGIPYKEEYWNQMNHLLDVNIPVSQGPLHAVKSTIKGLFKGIKLFYLATGTSILFVSTYLILQNAPQLNSEPVGSVQMKIKEGSMEQEKLAEHVKPGNKETISDRQQSAVKFDPENKLLHEKTKEQKNRSLSGKMLNQEESGQVINGGKLKEETSGYSGIDLNNEQVNENTLSNESHQITEYPVGGNTLSKDLIPETNETIRGNVFSNDLIRIKSLEFNFIKNFDGLITTPLSPLALQQVFEKAFRKRFMPVRQLSVSTVLGLRMDNGKQAANTGNNNYTNVDGANLMYGINVEAGFRKFAIRTGIAWGSYSLNSEFKSNTNNYKVDTSYVIVNPNYGTTPSGKPYALIRTKFDSTLTGTQLTEVNSILTYQFLTVPLTIQYQIYHRRFSFVLEGGTLHHFMISTARETTIPQGNSELNPTISSYQIQLTAGAGLRYAINTNWALGLQYNYSTKLKDKELLLPGNAHLASFMVIRTIW